MNCPVCGLRIEDDLDALCRQCGWEFRLYVTELSPEENELHSKKLEIMKRNWSAFQELRGKEGFSASEDLDQASLPEDPRNVMLIPLSSSRCNKNRFSAIAISPDGGILATGSEDGIIRLWDILGSSQRPVIRDHQKAVHALCFSPNGSMLLSAGDDCTLRLNEVESGRLIRSFEGHKNPVRCICFSPDARFAASGSTNGTLCLHELNTGILLPSERATAKVIHDIHDDSGCFQESEIIVCEPDLLSVSISQDGKFIAAGCDYGVVALWELSSGKLTEATSGYDLFEGMPVCFGPDNRSIAASYESYVKIHNIDYLDYDYLDSGEPISLYLHSHDHNRYSSVCFHPDETLLAAGDDNDGTVEIWEVESKSKRLLKTLRWFPCWEKGEEIRSVCFSSNGRLVTSGSVDGTVHIWEVESEALLLTFQILSEDTSVTYTPKGYYDFIGSFKSLKRRVIFVSKQDIANIPPAKCRTYPFEAFKSYFHRPDLIEKALE
ncbi:WD40 repeat domain-containing protein [Desulforhabdus sp. TSK]|uniref:WD40 repeat domain-containing protein n=1 Tax=Desulforhabdus sp. TSK TaxID=2925014 RepID=UPI001FC83AB0|nr:WD40 repeat domain-containing protein [Desulforhabdus sp. TSK]GKT09144.1 hypothetical protein DSTSK_24490 [Desulforhabdus sp. TSK]